MESRMAEIRGPLRTVEADITAVISDPSVETLCRFVGVVSAGFLFMNVHDGMIRFLADQDGNAVDGGAKLEDGVRTPYFWGEKSDVDLRRCIHALFSIVRRRQAQEDISWSREASLLRIETEYTLNLPRNLPEASRRVLVVSDVAHRFDIHYPTIGELWLTCLTWRRLCRARDAGLGEYAVDNLPADMADMDTGHSKLLWRSQPITEIASPAECVDLEPLLQRWHRDVCQGTSWRAELSSYFSSDTNGPFGDWRIRSAMQFARRIGVSLNFNGTGQPEEIDDVISESIGPLLAVLEEIPPTLTVLDAIERLERRSRLPILPFFLWNHIERAPITFLACPVWTSQQFPMLVRQEHCHHLGLALCAVEPIAELEGLSPEDGLSSHLPTLRTTNAEVLVALLRLIARPLVEGSLYAPIVDELHREAQKEVLAREFFRNRQKMRSEN